MINTYKSYGLEVIPNPFSEHVLTSIKRALQEEMPFSVIRIGDGESNLLTYSVYSNTKNLDCYSVKAIIAMQQDSFIVDGNWMIILRDLIVGAVAQANVVGVIGLWRGGCPTTEEIVKNLSQDYRGSIGHWRAVDYMLSLAGKDYLNKKIVASAHLYFSIMEHLNTILPLAKKVFIISNNKSIVEKLRRNYLALNFEYIPVGNTKISSKTLPDKPIFLSFVFSALPQDMRGCLCLIGAGPWAEIYCTWVKQRGGVGIDIGSGCDLLDGKATHTIHRRVNIEKYFL